MVSTDSTAPAADLILARFRTRVDAAPDATAVVDGTTTLTYAELADRAARIAGALAAEGVARGDLVAIALPRSADAIAAMLGVLFAGAGYVPIDTKYPASRAAYMLRNASVKVALATSGAGSADSGLDDVTILDVSIAATHAPSRAQVPDDPDIPAYVIYTSGSTGTPKGVEIPRRGLAHYIGWAADYYVQGEPVDMPLFSSLAFDLTVTSIYLPLVTGGRIVVYGESESARDLSIYGVIRDDRVDMIKLTPSHLALMGRMDLAGSRCRKLILGGEDLKASLAQKIHRAFEGRIEIYNEYGPTEATVGCMEYRFDPDTDRSGSVPIGRAIAGSEIRLIDEHGDEVAPGDTGEIHIGGPGLATGYVNQLDATRERFVPDPVNPGARLYRTGDLARQLPGGAIEYAGRVDRQVKLGGHRIELGEIESALHEHPDVSAAAVIVYRPAAARDEVFHCVRCALPSNYPGVTYDETGLCSVCRDFDEHRHLAEQYFRTEEELEALLADARATSTGDYDCLMLLSGGKDSSYVLYQLLARGLRVLAYTLDNGYISENAKANIRRIVAALGVDHVFATTEAMDTIFRYSLEQFSNVCNGCFKTLYTLSMQLAAEKGIRYVVTGLSRGQLFETRFDFLLRNRIFDVDAIERDVQRARRIYHARNDVVSKCLPMGPNVDPDLLAEIRFIDFYRYTDVGRDEIMGFLESTDTWVRPKDTGRSTNCLINDVGIYVHNRERGFHNYALPYCWEVRLGLLDRDEALYELGTDVNMENVNDILDRIAYESADAFSTSEPRLVAYYASEGDGPDAAGLRAQLAASLPAHMVPAEFVSLPELPLTVNGKVDWEALPEPAGAAAPPIATTAPAPVRDALEAEIAEIWERLLGRTGIGSDARFFDAGGTSMLAVLLFLELEDLLGGELPDPSTVERGWTISEQAELLREHGYAVAAG